MNSPRPSREEPARAAAPEVEGWDTASRADFYAYYEQASLSDKTMERFRLITETLLRLIGGAGSGAARRLEVLDIGCGAGAQSKFWLQHGHRYCGVDINRPLIELARQRAAQFASDATFHVGTATQLPCADAAVDVCLLPELLEHVADWQGCLDEAARVLRPGGWMYINTSSQLCPVQQEFNLPLYGWYPAAAKRYFERRAVTDWPAVANHATYPAVNWFSYYGLRDRLQAMGFRCLDRFDLIDTARQGTLARAVLATVRQLPPLRWLAHVMTPYTLVVAVKQGGGARPAAGAAGAAGR